MIDTEKLKTLVPLMNLSADVLERFAKMVEVESHHKGDIICRQGDNDNDALYLLEGGVEMKTGGSALSTVVQGGTEEADHPLAHSRPRQFTVTATTDVQLLRIDSNKLDRMVVLDELTTSITQIQPVGSRQFTGDTEWLEQMAGNVAFSKLTKEQLAAVVLKMKPLGVKAGAVVVKQGDPGRNYYVIKSGDLSVGAKGEDGKMQLLARLKPGDVFGEEALITGDVRNASVVASTDAELMKLAKSDFDDMLRIPLVNPVGKGVAEQMVREGAKILDVRPEAEFSKGALKGSINIPVPKLRAALDKLDNSIRYIVCCESGIQSEVAAFVMSQRGFDSYMLRGGLASLKK